MVTDDDVAFYERHGWWVSPPVFSGTQVDAALAAARAYHAAHPDRLVVRDYVVFDDAALAAIGLAPVLGAMAARLARTPATRLFHSALVHKPPRSGDGAQVGWHAERAYWRTSTSDRMLSAWIPLQDCDEAMGTISMLDGSHRWPETPALAALRSDMSFSGDPAELERRIAALGHPVRKVTTPMRRGQVSFHNCLTFHGSGPNRSGTPRVSLVVHLQDAANRYRRVLDAAGEPVTCHLDAHVRRLPTGEPDYADPALCPVLWAAA
jgi:ectoine hydroxylase-related dioxygenase (phytanoyl-CoA dioxygenase family)